MPQHLIHIPKGEDLAEWSIRRVLLAPDHESPHRPTGSSYEPCPTDWMEVRITVHAGLVQRMRSLAEQLAVTHDRLPTFDFGQMNNQRGAPQVLEKLDRHTLQAWNLEYCEAPVHHTSPSLRMNQHWAEHLGFLRLFTATKYLTRKFRVRMVNPTSHDRLWEPVYDDKLEEECSRVHHNLRTAFENLRHNHYVHPQTTTTTVTISRT